MRNRLKRLRRIRLHHEGTHILVLGALTLIFMNVTVWLVCHMFHLLEPHHVALMATLIVVSAVVYGIVLNFFRCPLRAYEGEEQGAVVAPADGKVVCIEEVYEGEYFRDRRLMVSIFMNLFNVHANWTPVSGRVQYVRHHDGNYHVAWLPKASIENERATVVIRTPEGTDVMARQIAGAMARRVVTYFQEGDEVEIDEHLGFIKFGSRVDVFLPLGTKVEVKVGQKTTGNETLICTLT